MTPYYDQDGITIYHADCRDVLPSVAAVDLVLTDPPFGIALANHADSADKWSKRYGAGGRAKRRSYDWSVTGDGDQGVGSEVIDFCRKWPLVAFASPKKPWPGEWRQHLVWDKGPAVGGGGDPATCWKPTWELIQVSGTPPLNGSRDSAVLTYWIGQSNYHDHPCQKPVSLLKYLIGKTTADGATVLDPFMGSGSTLRAAKDLGRRAIGIEIEERYCEIAAKRLQQAVLPLEGVG